MWGTPLTIRQVAVLTCTLAAVTGSEGLHAAAEPVFSEPGHAMVLDRAPNFFDVPAHLDEPVAPPDEFTLQLALHDLFVLEHDSLVLLQRIDLGTPDEPLVVSIQGRTHTDPIELVVDLLGVETRFLLERPTVGEFFDAFYALTFTSGTLSLWDNSDPSTRLIHAVDLGRHGPLLAFDGDESMRIGSADQGAQLRLKIADLQSIRLWNRALTADEQALYRAGCRRERHAPGLIYDGRSGALIEDGQSRAAWVDAGPFELHAELANINGGNPMFRNIGQVQTCIAELISGPRLAVEFNHRPMRNGEAASVLTGGQFGDVLLGTRIERTLWLHNPGPEALTIERLNLAGDTEGFSVNVADGLAPLDGHVGQLAPNASARVTLGFTPHSLGASTAELQLWSDAGFGPLTGGGQPFVMHLRAEGVVDTDGDAIFDRDDLDDDNDGLPDLYEQTFGLDPLDASDAAEDQDGDGYSNATEFEVGTNPNESGDRPHGRLGFHLDGVDDHIVVTEAPRLAADTGFTAELRFQADRLHTGTLISQFSDEAAGERAFAILLKETGELEFSVSPDGIGERYFVTESLVVPGAWYHVGLMFDGQSLLGFVNGHAVGAVHRIDSVAGSARPILIGARRNDSPELFFHGTVDEIRLWRRPLSVGDLLDHLACATPPASADLLLHLDFDDAGVGPGLDNQHTTVSTDTTPYQRLGILQQTNRIASESNWVLVPEEPFQRQPCAPPGVVAIQVLRDSHRIDTGDTSPDPLDGTDFGDTLAGQPVTREFIVSNTGSETVEVSIPLFAQRHLQQNGFAVLGEFPATLAPGAFTRLPIRFEQTALGAHQATVTIRTDSLRLDDLRFTIAGLVDGDADADGIPNLSDPDDDNDGVPDEIDTDDDGDGMDDAIDADDDNDGLPDVSEGLPNGSGDDDADGFTNAEERSVGTSTTDHSDHPYRAVGLQLDGDDFIRAPQLLDRGATFSLELWIRPDRRGSAGLVSKFDTSSRRETLGFSLDDAGRPLFEFVDERQAFSDGPSIVVRGDDPIPLGAWSYLAVTYDGVFLTIYVNGRKTAEHLAFEVRRHLTTTDALLGAADNGRASERHFVGAIDDIRAWERALTANEVAAHAAYRPENNTGLVADFRLEEGVPGADNGESSTLINSAAEGDLPAASLGAGFSRRGATSNWVETLTRVAQQGILPEPAPPTEDATRGLALALDGRKSLSISNPPPFHREVTVEAWIRPHAVDVPMTIVSAVPDFPALSYMSGFELWTDGMGQLHFNVGSVTVPAFASHPQRLTAGQWVHVAGTFDGQQPVVWVNGVPSTLGTPASDFGRFWEHISLSVGGRSAATFDGHETTQRFNGELDEVRVWSSVRDANALASAQACRFEEVPPTLQVYADMENGQPVAHPIFGRPAVRERAQDNPLLIEFRFPQDDAPQWTEGAIAGLATGSTACASGATPPETDGDAPIIPLPDESPGSDPAAIPNDMFGGSGAVSIWWLLISAIGLALSRVRRHRARHLASTPCFQLHH